MSNEFEKLNNDFEPIPDEIITMNWNMYKVHKLLGNRKTSKKYLENSYFEIKSRSKNIKVKQDREKYLSVKQNQEIITAWDS